jgi:peptide subunit release factor RF-3
VNRTAKWLNDEERDWAVERMGEFAPKSTDKHFDKDDFIATITAPMFWIFAIQYFFMTNSLNAFGYFAPTIIKDIGFTGCELRSGEL